MSTIEYRKVEDGEYKPGHLYLGGKETGQALCDLFNLLFDALTRLEDKIDGLQEDVDSLNAIVGD